MATKYAVRYFSASKKAEIDIESMHSSHLIAARAKLGDRILRGEANKLEPNQVRAGELYDALDAEYRKRGLDQPKPEEAAS